MKRREPPPLATWMLEHCTTGDGNEALAGDVLEGFRSGRSDAWYWRQALAACLFSWINYLRARLSLLVFAFLWSMLAPAWTAILDRVENNSLVLNLMWRMDWPFSTIATFSVWMFLNLLFIWVGILFYLVAHARFSERLSFRKVTRSLFVGLGVFLLIYFATFILMNLFAFPGPVIDRRTITPMREIVDLRMWAIVLRIPYLLTMLCALWRLAPAARNVPWTPAVSFQPKDSARRSAPPALANLDSFTLRRFFCLMVIAGLLNAMIASFMLCRLPDSPMPSISSLLQRAVFYVAIGVFAGVAGAWIYWKSPSSPFRERPPIPFALFALVCAAGWAWVPSMMILSEQISPATAIVAAIGAILLAAGLRRATSSVFASSEQSSMRYEASGTELFAESLSRTPAEAKGYVIAICLYAAAWALYDRSSLTAAAFFALSSFLFAWNRTFVRSHDNDGNHAYMRAALRLGCVLIPAILITTWSLLDGVAHRNRHAAINAALAADEASSSERAQQRTKSQSSAHGLGGYESLILWPPPLKEQIIPPIPAQEPFLALGTTRPFIIPFDGSYWYVEPPDKLPGPTAHEAHGTPLGAEIQSNNFIPLTMAAHQLLSAPVPTARCGQIEVEIENLDNRSGVIAMAILLADSTSSGRPTLYLGQQPIVSTEPGHFAFKSVPLFETLRFSIPPGANIRTFNEITVMMLPDIEHAFVAPKIAIQQFQLFPR